VARKDWILAGMDSGELVVISYNTGETAKRFRIDWPSVCGISSISVHSTQPLVLAATSNGHVGLWNWEQDWREVTHFDHSVVTSCDTFHPVMAVAFDPNGSNGFASVSMDKTIKLWNTGSVTPTRTLRGHEGSSSPPRTPPFAYVCEAKILSVVFLPAEEGTVRLATGGEDGTLRAWRIDKWTTPDDTDCNVATAACHTKVRFTSPGVRLRLQKERHVDVLDDPR
jgi:WD40 repeat protein